MAKARVTPEQMKQMGLIEVNGIFVKASSQVDPNPVKIPNMLERALQQKEMSNVNFVTSAEDPKSENKKIKNAKKVTLPNGVVCDSRLEAYAYTQLQEAGIEFEFQKVFTIQPKFRYGTEAVRAIKSIVDFYIKSHNAIVDAKGFSNDVSPVKYKVLKYRLYKYYKQHNLGMPPTIYMPRNKTQINELILKLKQQ